ncbi:hypothetical protein [Streptomyces arboris]|uniref:hypothetical protein n=1 Tax=Streptomyces arboris TaxID=2600619 RepID=UPI003BF4D8A5
MNAKRVSAAAGVVLAAQKRRQTPAGIAAALEAAGLLQSPESAAELVRWRERTEEAETSEAQLKGQVRGLRAHVAELEARPSPAEVLRQVADQWAAHCPEHSDADDVWMDCPADWVFELRRAADERPEVSS